MRYFASVSITALFFSIHFFAFNLMADLPLPLPEMLPIDQQSIVGEWWSPKKDARITIENKDGKFQGHLSWIRPEDAEKKDDKNPDEKLRDQPLKGLVILKDFIFKDEKWIDGSIYDPKNGKTYSCKMTVEKNDRNKLNIRGYIGISLFGRSETFTRYQKDQF